jgi:PIN domain nuclease of toxin-antitoxin system
MNLLLDTHTFIWWDTDPARLPARVLKMCRDPANRLLLSVASVWEMQIKLQLGKLRLAVPLQSLIEGQQRTNAIEIVSVTLPHVLDLDNLPGHHKDPFDRLPVAQARVEQASLVSVDPVFSAYPVQVLW